MIKVTGACDAGHAGASFGAFADPRRCCHPRQFDKLFSEIAVVNFLIATMRAILIATGITPPTPENERKVLLILFLILIGLALGTWLTFKFLVPLMA